MEEIKVLCFIEKEGVCCPRLVPIGELLLVAEAANMIPGSKTEGLRNCTLRWEVGSHQLRVYLEGKKGTALIPLQPVLKKCLLACCVFSHLGETLTPEQLAEMKGGAYAISAVYARIAEIRRAIDGLNLGIKGEEVLETAEGAYRIAPGIQVEFPPSLAFSQAPHYFCYLRGSALRRRFGGQPELLAKFERFARERGLGALLDQ